MPIRYQYQDDNQYNISSVTFLCQLDIIVADLDGSAISVPENVQLAVLPATMLTRMQHDLTLVRTHVWLSS